MASGDVVNTAARLQAAAPVNGILVDETTQRATTDAIAYEDAEPVEAKGKAEHVAVWRAVKPRSRVGAERSHAAPLVGRSMEAALLVDGLGRVKRERVPQLVTLVGVPGIGKSRLVYELHRLIESGGEPFTWLQGRALPYGEAVAFWPLAEMVKAQAGILDSDSAAVAEEKLTAAIATVDLPDAGWVESQLRPLVGLAGPGGRAEEGRSEAFAAWRRFFESLAEQRPLVLVFEDLHWADDGVLDFVDHLVEWASGVPILVVCSARPELLVRRPGWGGGKANAVTSSLSPLSDDETARLLSALLRGAVLPAETQVTLLAVAGGNPLYAEQYARMLAETGGAERVLPETVQGIIAARIDGLSTVEKAALQDASVVGRVFWLGVVAAIGGLDRWQAEELLHALERKEFVRHERRSSVEGDSEYAFRHLVVREVAYGQIPRAERAEKHARAAEWIESLGRPAEHAETLAHHYASALELAKAAGRDTAPLEAPARLAFNEAGDRAAALFSYATALRFYEPALELWPEGDPERAELLFRRAEAGFHFDQRAEPLAEAREALLGAGDSERAAEAEMLQALGLGGKGDPKGSLEHAARAATAVRAAPPSQAKTFVLANQARILAVNGHSEEAIAIARKALADATALGLEELRANALNTIGLGRMDLDDTGGLEELEESLRLVLEHGSPFELGRVYNNLAWSYVEAGRLPGGLEVSEARLASSRRYGLQADAVQGAGLLAVIRFLGGDWDAALRLVEEVLENVQSNENRRIGGLGIRAAIRLGRDELAGASADAERAVELGRTPDLAAAWRVLGLAISIRIGLACGRRSHAEALGIELDAGLVEALAQLRGGPTALLELLCTLRELGRPLDPLAQAASARPRWVWSQPIAAVARGELTDAADRLAELGAKTHEAYFRLRAAEQLTAEGRAPEAAVQLERALAFYRAAGASRYIREGEALLAATA